MWHRRCPFKVSICASAVIKPHSFRKQVCSIPHNYRVLSTIAENAPALSCPPKQPAACAAGMHSVIQIRRQTAWDEWYACNGCHYMAFQAESMQAALATFDAYLKLLPDKWIENKQGVLPCLFNNGDRLSGDAYRKINRRKASTAGHKTHIIVASNNETSTKSRYLWKM